MTYNQLIAQAKFHRKTADQLEVLAKKQLKLQTQIDRLNGTGRSAPKPKAKLPANAVEFRTVNGPVSKRILDLLATKEMHVHDMWAKLEPEQVTPNYLAMCRTVYSLGKKGLLESTSMGVWRRTVSPVQGELHFKAQ